MDIDQFFVVRVRFLKEGGIKKSELMSYLTQDQAVSKFHSNLAVDMVDPTLTGSMCSVLGIDGNCIKQDCWGYYTDEEPAPEPEPEPEEE